MSQYQPHPALRSQNRRLASSEREGKRVSPAQVSPARKDALTPDRPGESPEPAVPTRRPIHSLATIPLFPPAESMSQGSAPVDAGAIQQAAEQGRRTLATPLPYACRLQASFGHHDLTRVQAHLGPQARASARLMRAAAFSSGEHVVFAGPPDLRTVAHEAAHVVQQRQGVQLPGGVGVEGDRYEQHAEAVAARVVAGQSVEEFLDRFAGRSQEKYPETPRGSEQTETVVGDSIGAPAHTTRLATGVVVQRLREGLTSETKPLTAKEDEAQRELFVQPPKAAKRKKAKKELVELAEKDVLPQYLDQLNDKLIKLAKTVNKDYDKKAAQYTKSTGNDLEKTPYYKILELAIHKALGHYGAILEAALKENTGEGPGPLAQHDKSPIGLKRSQQIYDDLREEDREGEARVAIQYVIEHNATIKGLMRTIRSQHQNKLPSDQELDPRSVEAAYVDALMHQGEKTELVEELAKQRVRHAPQTRGSTVYIEATDKEHKATAWLHYRQLVHEALHTAAHSRFEAYLNSVPEELRDTVNEGTVEYFAWKVWKQVASQLQEGKSNPDFTAVHGIIDPPEATPDQITELDVEIAQKNASITLYPEEVKTIERAVKELGEDRLKAAFFYGDVDHFFPTFVTAMEEEKPVEEEERSTAPQRNSDNEGKQEVKPEQLVKKASERKKLKVTEEGNQ